MATETLLPDALISSSNVTGAFGDIDEGTTSPDGNWLVATSNNTNNEVYLSFPTPSGDLSGTQTFNAWVRQFDGGQGGTPKCRIELWENGTLISAGSDTNVTSSTGQLISYTFADSAITTIANAEIKLIGTKSGGSPGNRNAVDFGATDWDVVYTAAAASITLVTQTYTLTGNTATFGITRELSGTKQTYTLSGQPATFSMGYAFAGTKQDYTLTGNDATFSRTRALVGTAQSYAITDNDAVLTRSYAFGTTKQTYTLTGQTATFGRGYSLITDVQTYALTGSNAGLAIDRQISGVKQTYTLTGNAATLTYTPVVGNVDMTADVQAYTVTGNSATLAVGRAIHATKKTYALVGKDTTHSIVRGITADKQTYTVTGNNTGFRADRYMTGVKRSYTITTSPLILSLSRGFLAANQNYAITGKNVTYLRNRVMFATQDNFKVTTNDISGGKSEVASNIIRLTRGGSTITMGQVTIDETGNASARQRTDEIIRYDLDWSEYFTRDAETVTVTEANRNVTINKVDGTDSTMVLASNVKSGDGAYVDISVAITGGETFIMRLNLTGQVAA